MTHAELWDVFCLRGATRFSQVLSLFNGTGALENCHGFTCWLDHIIKKIIKAGPISWLTSSEGPLRARTGPPEPSDPSQTWHQRTARVWPETGIRVISWLVARTETFQPGWKRTGRRRKRARTRPEQKRVHAGLHPEETQIHSDGTGRLWVWRKKNILSVRKSCDPKL